MPLPPLEGSEVDTALCLLSIGVWPIAISSASRRDQSKPFDPTHAREPRWLGDFQILFLSRIGWAPMGFVRRILSEMLRLGLLIWVGAAAPADFDHYPLSCMAVDIANRSEGGVA